MTPSTSPTARTRSAAWVRSTTLLVAEQSFRKLECLELLADVAAGVEYEDGVRVRRPFEGRRLIRGNTPLEEAPSRGGE